MLALKARRGFDELVKPRATGRPSSRPHLVAKVCAGRARPGEYLKKKVAGETDVANESERRLENRLRSRQEIPR